MLAAIKARVEEVARSLAGNYRGDANLRGRVEGLERQVAELRGELVGKVDKL